MANPFRKPRTRDFWEKKRQNVAALWDNDPNTVPVVNQSVQRPRQIKSQRVETKQLVRAGDKPKPSIGQTTAMRQVLQQRLSKPIDVAAAQNSALAAREKTQTAPQAAIGRVAQAIPAGLGDTVEQLAKKRLRAY